MEDNPAQILARIRSVMKVTNVNPPATEAMVEGVEEALGVAFPPWLRRIYRACNGFSGPTGVHYLWPLDGREGVQEFTLFLRAEEYWPDWLDRAIVFSDNGLGGSITVHWAALNGNLVEWCYGDSERFDVLEFDLFELWRREQARWDAVG